MATIDALEFRYQSLAERDADTAARIESLTTELARAFFGDRTPTAEQLAALRHSVEESEAHLAATLALHAAGATPEQIRAADTALNQARLNRAKAGTS